MNNQTIDQSIEVLSKALKDLSENKEKIDLGNLTYLDFKATTSETNYGKGIIFSGNGTTKQIVLGKDPDRFFISEHIDLAKDKVFSINRTKILDSKELGSSVVKSNLQEVGRLKGLIVDGSVSINQHFYYDSITDRLGLGTDQPNAALSVVDNGIEILVGVNHDNEAIVGTFSSKDFSLISGSIPRITIKANGSIDLGNVNNNPSSVRVHGKLAVGVRVPDPAVDLHVAGPVRIHNQLQMYAEETPKSGAYQKGDIIWNSNPKPGGNVGWICTRSGDPGVWNRFGEIK